MTLLWTLGCSIDAKLMDLSVMDVTFESPAKNIYHNKHSFDFKVSLNSNNPNLTLEKAQLQVYQSTDCDPETLLETRSLQAENSSATTDKLENGEKYSARILIKNADKSYQSVCSPWVGIDTLQPSSVAVTYPNNNTYVVSRDLLD